MLSLKGIPKNIDMPLTGKISFSQSEKNERPFTIIVNPNPEYELADYMALLLTDDKEYFKSSKVRMVCNIKRIQELSDGDIVEIFPDGSINVLFQINSMHNVLFVTSKCNSKCIMCPQPVDDREGNLLETNLKLIALMDKSIMELALTGGEPTLIGKDLFRLILACKAFLPDTALLLLTNARKFNDFEYTRFYSSLRHPNITVGVALYGDNDMEHDFIAGFKGAFNETIKGIINLASFNNSIEIRTVIHKFTYERLLRLSEFIYRNMPFVKHVAFMGLEAVWRAKNNLELLWIEPEKIVGRLEDAVHYLTQRGIHSSIYNIPLCLLTTNLWKFARQSISEWKNSFDPRCHNCSVKDRCSGMFDSTAGLYGKYLKPIS